MGKIRARGVQTNRPLCLITVLGSVLVQFSNLTWSIATCVVTPSRQAAAIILPLLLLDGLTDGLLAASHPDNSACGYYHMCAHLYSKFGVLLRLPFRAGLVVKNIVIINVHLHHDASATPG